MSFEIDFNNQLLSQPQYQHFFPTYFVDNSNYGTQSSNSHLTKVSYPLSQSMDFRPVLASSLRSQVTPPICDASPSETPNSGTRSSYATPGLRAQAKSWTQCRFCCRNGNSCKPSGNPFQCEHCLGKDRICKEPIQLPASIRPGFWSQMAGAALGEQGDINLIDRWETLRSTTLRISCNSSCASGSKNSQMATDYLDDFTLKLKDLEETSFTDGTMSNCAGSLARVLGLTEDPSFLSGDVESYEAKELLLRIEVSTQWLHQVASLTGPVSLLAIFSKSEFPVQPGRVYF